MQGAGGGVATAAIVLGPAAGLRVLVDQPRRGQAGAGAGARRARGLRVRRPAAGQGRRGHRDRRRGDLVALDPGAAPRRPDRHLRHDVGPEPRRRRADPDLLPPAQRRSARRWAPATSSPSLVALLDATGARPLIDRDAADDRGARRVRRDARRRAVRQDRVHPLMATHLVTGAGSGIGARRRRAAARARRPTSVLLARSTGAGRRAGARTCRARTVLVADLAWPESVESLALPDALDSVVHAAGVVELGPVAELSRRRLGRPSCRVNLVAPAALTRVALPALRAARGTVVFVNSGAGLDRAPGLVGVRRLEARPARARRLAARRGGGHGVRVSTVYPGRTATPDAGEGARARRARSTTPPPGSGPRPSPTRSCTCSTCRATRRSPTSTVRPGDVHAVRAGRVRASVPERQFSAPTSTIRSWVRACSTSSFSASGRPATPRIASAVDDHRGDDQVRQHPQVLARPRVGAGQPGQVGGELALEQLDLVPDRLATAGGPAARSRAMKRKCARCWCTCSTRMVIDRSTIVGEARVAAPDVAHHRAQRRRTTRRPAPARAPRSSRSAGRTRSARCRPPWPPGAARAPRGVLSSERSSAASRIARRVRSLRSTREVVSAMRVRLVRARPAAAPASAVRRSGRTR